MKKYLLALLMPALIHVALVASPFAGFFLPDSLSELKLRYKTINNLIVLPVTINDTVTVNLILDTGCRNMLLFGKQFENMFQTTGKPVQFSGLGTGKPVQGKLAIDNNVSIGAVQGKRIPIIIVPERNMFRTMRNIDGIIGYEIFVKFEIELDFRQQTITFRPGNKVRQIASFDYVPMKIVDSRPVVECVIKNGDNATIVEQLLIDTGSTLGLLLGRTASDKEEGKAIGRGLNGSVKGYQTITKTVKMSHIEFRNVSTSIVNQRDKYASIGLQLLQGYIVVLNYSQNYVGFREA